MGAGGGKSSDGLPAPDSDLQLVRILDRTLKSRHPDGVSLLKTLEGGLVMDLHRRIDQPFNPHACAKATELTEYLWTIKRVPTIEPGGGITIRGKKFATLKEGRAARLEKYVIGRKFYSEAQIEYRLIHSMIAEALGM